MVVNPKDHLSYLIGLFILGSLNQHRDILRVTMRLVIPFLPHRLLPDFEPTLGLPLGILVLTLVLI